MGAPARGSSRRLVTLDLAPIELEQHPVAHLRDDVTGQLEVRQADVTTLEVDAIANAANTDLLHGGGVAAAISRAGGPAVQRESHERADRPR